MHLIQANYAVWRAWSERRCPLLYLYYPPSLGSGLLADLAAGCSILHTRPQDGSSSREHPVPSSPSTRPTEL